MSTEPRQFNTCGSYFAGDSTFDPVTNHFLIGAGNAIRQVTQTSE